MSSYLIIGSIPTKQEYFCFILDNQRKVDILGHTPSETERTRDYSKLLLIKAGSNRIFLESWMKSFRGHIGCKLTKINYWNIVKSTRYDTMGGSTKNSVCVAGSQVLGESNRTNYIETSHYVNILVHPQTIYSTIKYVLEDIEHLSHALSHKIPMKIHTNQVINILLRRHATTHYHQKQRAYYHYPSYQSKRERPIYSQVSHTESSSQLKICVIQDARQSLMNKNLT